MLLGDAPVIPTIPVSDLERAKDFYERKLGLKQVEEAMPDGIVYEAGGGSRLYVYEREPDNSPHTLAGFEVKDIEKTVDDLGAMGIMFEQYDMPGNIKTDERGIATMGNIRSAWFKDPDGNILAITETES
jgi:catechol 2,3-dioxygenase-like lactoylglutathione lyase family enzyme